MIRRPSLYELAIVTHLYCLCTYANKKKRAGTDRGRACIFDPSSGLIDSDMMMEAPRAARGCSVSEQRNLRQTDSNIQV
jgi:hypothetical protein